VLQVIVSVELADEELSAEERSDQNAKSALAARFSRATKLLRGVIELHVAVRYTSISSKEM
jgi:hypothetical protein